MFFLYQTQGWINEMSEVPENQQSVPETPAQNGSKVPENQQSVPETPVQNGSKVPKNQQKGNGKLILVTCASALILASITFITLQLSGFAWYSSIIPALLLIAVLLYLGYTLGSSWTGFGYLPYPDGKKEGEFQRAKTLWDWLQLLIISAVLTVGGLWFNGQQNQTSLSISNKQHQVDLQIADNQQQATILSNYIGDMSNLLLNNKINLQDSQPGDEIRIVARAKTLLALRILEPDHKGNLVQFLYEADLISEKRQIIDLNLADLHGIDLSNAQLDGIDLKGANMSGANLKNTSLNGADLSGVNLGGADLNEAKLDCIKVKTDCIHANLSHADLSRADLSYADLSYADLSYAQLENATMSYTILNSAELGHADLSNTDLRYANMSNASMFLANLGSVNLNYAILRYTNLGHADLNHADLSYANLYHADLARVDFNHANLSYANLSYALLFGIDPSYANFQGADLSYADLRFSSINKKQIAEAKTIKGAKR